MKTYYFRKLIVLIVFTLSLISNSYSQLKGTYIVGGTIADYPTIDKAIEDVENKGVTGSVIFNIRPGTYPGFSIGAIPKLVYPDSIILQSETHDSTDVIISGTVNLTSASGITLRWLTLKNDGYDKSIAVYFNRSYNCNILNCLINTPNSRGEIDYNHSAIDIDHTWELPHTSIRIENCQLIGKGCGFNVNGTKGLTQIINCKVSSSGRYSFSSNWIENIIIKDSYLNGSVKLHYAIGSLFINNFVNAKEIDIRGFNIIEGNEFISLDLNSIKIDCGILRNNHFNNNAAVAAKLIDSNRFDSNFSSSYRDYFQFFNNTVTKKLNFSYCDNLQIARNVIHGTTSLSYVDYAVVDNNVFHDIVSIGISYNNKFYYNNFVDSAFLASNMASVDVQFNNFNREISVVSGSLINNNNYFPTGGFWDKHPYRYNPLYLSQTTSIATNPLLMGKGKTVSFISQDINGNTRPKHPTLGANEICVPSFSDLDTVIIDCGDGLWLNRCDANKLTGHRWSPSSGLNDTISASTMAKPNKNTLYYLVDKNDFIIDSVFINVRGFRTEGIDSFNLGTCGSALLLSKNFNPSATYSWSPSTQLSDSTIYNPLASPMVPTNYIQKISIPGCGSFIDSTFLDIDSRPIANTYPFPNGLVVSFYNYSQCADNYLWNFGDSTQSTDEAPVHSYDTVGRYNGSLTAYNQFGVDTFNFTVKVFSLGIKPIGANQKFAEVFPNPSNGLINIRFKTISENTTFSVYNFLGQLVHTEPLNNVSSLDYNLPETKGIYIIQFVQANNTSYNYKVIKN